MHKLPLVASSARLPTEHLKNFTPLACRVFLMNIGRRAMSVYQNEPLAITIVAATIKIVSKMEMLIII